MIQYDLKNDGSDPMEAGPYVGLVDLQLNPKPAFYAVKRLAQVTQGFKVSLDLKGIGF